jgi:hypothetical protein
MSDTVSKRTANSETKWFSRHFQKCKAEAILVSGHSIKLEELLNFKIIAKIFNGIKVVNYYPNERKGAARTITYYVAEFTY